MNEAMTARANRRSLWRTLLFALLGAVTSSAFGQDTGEFQQPDAPEAPPPITDAKPLAPQPGAETVTPGLAVNYFYDKFYILDEINEADDPVKGEPIANLDHVTETGAVLTAEYPIMVGAKIRGLLNLDQPGTYGFRVNSNDGVRVWIGDELLWEDPEVHFDRLSPPLEVTIQEGGWYDFKVDYFQKKGSSALQLFWTPPGGEETVVPPEAFAHLSE